MTHPIPQETVEHERYVDGLCRSHAEMLAVLDALREKIKRGSVLKNERVYFTAEEFDRINAVVARAEGTGLPPLSKTITVHLEGGLVQDVTGIPAGYEVRVEDRDEGDTSHPSWDAESGSFVTVYGGDGL